MLTVWLISSSRSACSVSHLLAVCNRVFGLNSGTVRQCVGLGCNASLPALGTSGHSGYGGGAAHGGGSSGAFAKLKPLRLQCKLESFILVGHRRAGQHSLHGPASTELAAAVCELQALWRVEVLMRFGPAAAKESHLAGCHAPSLLPTQHVDGKYAAADVLLHHGGGHAAQVSAQVKATAGCRSTSLLRTLQSHNCSSRSACHNSNGLGAGRRMGDGQWNLTTRNRAAHLRPGANTGEAYLLVLYAASKQSWRCERRADGEAQVVAAR
jgi:hypothetical protein